MSVTLEPDETLPHRQGINELRAGNPEKAAQFFLKAIEENTHFTDAWYLLAQALAATREFQGALVALDNALHLDPGHSHGRILRQKVHREIERGAIAIESKKPIRNPGEIDAEQLFQLIEAHGPNGGHQAQGIPMASARNFFTSDLAWAVPSREAIKAIIKFAKDEPILEVGGGKALWASLIQQMGGTVIASDNFSTHCKPRRAKGNVHHQVCEAFTFVERLNHLEALAKYPFCPTLMMCWPPFGLGMSEESLNGFRGTRFIYIGEKQAAAESVTGSLSFHETLSANWTLSTQVDIPRWPGVYDAVFLYNRTV